MRDPNVGLRRQLVRCAHYRRLRGHAATSHGGGHDLEQPRQQGNEPAPDDRPVRRPLRRPRHRLRRSARIDATARATAHHGNNRDRSPSRSCTQRTDDRTRRATNGHLSDPAHDRDGYLRTHTEPPGLDRHLDTHTTDGWPRGRGSLERSAGLRNRDCRRRNVRNDPWRHSVLPHPQELIHRVVRRTPVHSPSSLATHSPPRCRSARALRVPYPDTLRRSITLVCGRSHSQPSPADALESALGDLLIRRSQVRVLSGAPVVAPAQSLVRRSARSTKTPTWPTDGTSG